jgi:hypothetical protein
MINSIISRAPLQEKVLLSLFYCPGVATIFYCTVLFMQKVVFPRMDVRTIASSRVLTSLRCMQLGLWKWSLIPLIGTLYHTVFDSTLRGLHTRYRKLSLACYRFILAAMDPPHDDRYNRILNALCVRARIPSPAPDRVDALRADRLELHRHVCTNLHVNPSVYRDYRFALAADYARRGVPFPREEFPERIV